MDTKLTSPDPKHDHLQGPIDAPITLLEYGDYQCPACGDAYPMVKAIQQRMGRELCFAFRNFPLTNIHPYAEHAAEVAEAAGVQGRFWEMHDLLFENQRALHDDDLVSYAKTLGLDDARLAREVRDGEHTARVREDFRHGVRAGVNATPTFFINGERYDGASGLEPLLAALGTRAA